MAKSFGRYLAETADDVADDRPQRARSWTCMANGCPATAGIDAGNGELICRFHHGTSGADWPEITRALRENLWAVKAANYCASGDVNPAWAERAKAAADAAGHPELRPDSRRMMPSGKYRDERMHAILYAQRLNAWLAGQCGTNERKPSDQFAKLREDLRAFHVAEAARIAMAMEADREARLEREAIQAEAGA